jgi:hypothetical protein
MKPEIFRFIRYSVVLCLLLFPSFSHAGTWVENFDDGDYNGWKLFAGTEPHRAQVKVVDGELVFRHFGVGAVEDYLILEASRNWVDYTLEFRFKFTDEVGLSGTRGMLVTYHDTFEGVPEGGPNTPLAALFGGGGVMGLVAIDGQFIGIKSGVFQFSHGIWYRVKILAQVTHYELFIDGQQVIAYDYVDGFTKGGIGIGAVNVVTHFDDIRISGDSVPDGGATAVQARGKLTTVWAALKK